MALLDVMEARWMDALHQTELKLFVDSVRRYFEVLTKQEPQITSAFLGTGDIDGYDFNGIVTFSGAYNGHVIVSMPPQLLKELLLLQGETDLSEGNLLDAVGRNRQHPGRQRPQDAGLRPADLGTGEAARLLRHQGARAQAPLCHHAALEPPAGDGLRGYGEAALEALRARHAADLVRRTKGLAYAPL